MAKKQIVPCLIHIPCNYPDGTEIEEEKVNEFLAVFDRQFGGCTPLGVVPGHWLDEGRTVTEPMLRVEVAVEKSAISRFESIARSIGRKTKQKEIYVVINYQAQARLLFIDPDEDEGDDFPRRVAGGEQ